MSKTLRFRTQCDSQHVKQSKKLHRSISMRIFHHFAKSKLENFHLSVSEIVGLFISTLTATDKYCLCNRENLPPPIQLQLSKKQKCFLNFLLQI